MKVTVDIGKITVRSAKPVAGERLRRELEAAVAQELGAAGEGLRGAGRSVPRVRVAGGSRDGVPEWSQAIAGAIKGGSGRKAG